MTQHDSIRRPHVGVAPLDTALRVAAAGVPVLPLRRGKLPFGNCHACSKSRCGDRPNMLRAGPCRCPRTCHAWAAATTDPDVLRSPAWAPAWREAATVAYHPAGAGLTVVDLDNAEAVSWARGNLPPTRTVSTTRGEHWIYQGTMPSSNGVRPGVDIKSSMSYARYVEPGTGAMAALPSSVRGLIAAKPATVRPAPGAIAAPSGGGECPHRTPTFLERGIAMAEGRITEARSEVHATVYRAFLAVLSVHGRCGCLTDGHVERLFAAAQAKGETVRHCTDAWTNARNRLGL